MIQLNINQEQHDKAKHMANDLGIIRNSIMGGKGNIAGFLGEIVIADYFGFNHDNSYDYDLVANDGTTIDVKTKQTNYQPLPYYDCSIAAYNTKQHCDYYCFTRIHYDMKTLWFLGMIKKQRYFEMSRFLKKGQHDGDNGFIVRADCYNLSIDDIWNTMLNDI